MKPSLKTTVLIAYVLFAAYLGSAFHYVRQFESNPTLAILYLLIGCVALASILNTKNRDRMLQVAAVAITLFLIIINIPYFLSL